MHIVWSSLGLLNQKLEMEASHPSHLWHIFLCPKDPGIKTIWSPDAGGPSLYEVSRGSQSRHPDTPWPSLFLPGVLPPSCCFCPSQMSSLSYLLGMAFPNCPMFERLTANPCMDMDCGRCLTQPSTCSGITPQILIRINVNRISHGHI